MSHMYAYGVQCPKHRESHPSGSQPAATQGDNTDIIVMNEALKLVKKNWVNVIRWSWQRFGYLQRDQPTPVLHPHFQPGKPTTVGKRATLWMQGVLNGP